MSAYTADEWREGQCWKNRFAVDVYSGVRTKPCCPQAGVYGQSDGPEKQFRWCAGHKMQSDTKQPEAHEQRAKYK